MAAATASRPPPLGGGSGGSGGPTSHSLSLTWGGPEEGEETPSSTRQQRHFSFRLPRSRRSLEGRPQPRGATAGRRDGGECYDGQALEGGERPPPGLGALAALSMLGVASVYATARGVLQGYQHLRRRLLRRLLLDTCPLLDRLGVPYYADFGTLLGLYRVRPRLRGRESGGRHRRAHCTPRTAAAAAAPQAYASALPPSKPSFQERDVILHDNDADVVVLNPDWEALHAGLRAALEPAGYRRAAAAARAAVAAAAPRQPRTREPACALGI